MWILLLILSLTASAEPLKRFIFGSCNDQTKAQPLWQDMLKRRPDLFIWGGDNVYVDREPKTNLARAFRKQLANKDYRRFRSKIKIIGTWDDHDYGGNNTNGFYPRKREAQRVFLDFMREPADSPRREQEGIYVSYRFGRIKFILLDNRYFLDLDPNAAVLGEEQWKWLEDELRGSDAEVTFIQSGLSILSPVIPFSDGTWANYPKERNRLLDLVERMQTKGVVFLTGDMHFSSIFRRRGHLEFMSSGMTHTANRATWWYLGQRFETSFFGLSYGEVDVNWDQEKPILTMSIRDRHGRSYHGRTFRLEGREWIEDMILTAD